jgi:hemoglobin
MTAVFVHLETQPNSLYARVGGEPFFYALVERFYAGVADDAVLRPLYPPDLEPPKRRLALFLMQYWGGPQTYSAERGHPRLRMRHVRFPIGLRERAAWLEHMAAAVAASDAPPGDKQALMDYFARAATSLLNRSEGDLRTTLP